MFGEMNEQKSSKRKKKVKDLKIEMKFLVGSLVDLEKIIQNEDKLKNIEENIKNFIIEAT